VGGDAPMAGAQLNGEMQVINGVVEAQVAARPSGATYLASTASLADSQGNFAAYLPSASGAEVNVRTPDGIHLAPEAASASPRPCWPRCARRSASTCLADPTVQIRGHGYGG